MDSNNLKQYIIDNDLLEKILCGLDFEFKSKGKYISMKNPDGNNKSAIVIFKNKLNVVNYTRGWNGDIFTLIEKIKNITFSDSIKLVKHVLGIKDCSDIKILNKPNILEVLSNLEKECNIKESISILDESILNNYDKKPNKIWYDEGISLETQAIFNICYDNKSNSIVIPIRDEFGNLVGVKNRKNTKENIDMKYYYSYPVRKTLILYGLDKNKEHILKQNLCIVVESEKAVMKLHSNDIKLAVAIGGSDISKEQVSMLEELGIKIILAFDKDVILDAECMDDCTDCDIKCMKKQLNKFSDSTDISCSIDEEDLLDEKDSPIDKGIDVFKKVIKNRYGR